MATIAKFEDLRQTRPLCSSETSQLLQLQLEIVETICQRVLLRLGTPPAIAIRVIEALVNSELEGYRSHGLLRLPEYVTAVRDGIIKPFALPTVEGHSQVSRMVDGQRGFGVLAADRVCNELSDLLTREPIAVVGLRNSNHVGRLAHLVYPLSEQGYIVIGFANYLGAGQKVPPWGGTEGRFCTNPIVFGIPTGNSYPIIVDMTTSLVAEGKVRATAGDGNPIPEGWLIDSNWNTVTEAKHLYTIPPTAYLAPLGGIAGYKGFALALAAEILAGIVTGAGYSQPTSELGGNGGLFIGMRSSLLGQSPQQVLYNIERLVNYCQTCPVAPGFAPIRMPGQASREAIQTGRRQGIIKVSRQVWQQIVDIDMRLAGRVS